MPHFERVTDKARRLIAFARNAAINRHLKSVDTDCLLAALRFYEDRNFAIVVLENLGVSREELAAEERAIVTFVDADVRATAPTREPSVGDLLAQARAESDSLNCPYLGTEHLLLAVFRDAENPTVAMLRERGVDHGSVHTEIQRVLSLDLKS